MAKERQGSNVNAEDTLPQEWADRAREAAARFNLPLPGDEATTAAEAEQRITQFEQRGGE